MSNELRKFLVILRPDSVAGAIFADKQDVIVSGMPAITCSEMDLSGAHARVKRIPVETSQAAKSGVQAQVFWIASTDIALAIEYTGATMPAGF